tara:strand:- start:152 stop:397 length:246 start_codon:yes stop_codon:yes gene_type:complete
MGLSSPPHPILKNQVIPEEGVLAFRIGYYTDREAGGQLHPRFEMFWIPFITLGLTNIAGFIAIALLSSFQYQLWAIRKKFT